MPRSEELGIVDWDHPDSWNRDAAVEALSALVATGEVQTPVYDISRSRAVDTTTVRADPHDLILAEGIFAAEIIGDLRERGLLAGAYCVHHHRLVTFVWRLLRDLSEHRKPPWTLVRRGLGTDARRAPRRGPAGGARSRLGPGQGPRAPPVGPGPLSGERLPRRPTTTTGYAADPRSVRPRPISRLSAQQAAASVRVPARQRGGSTHMTDPQWVAPGSGGPAQPQGTPPGGQPAYPAMPASQPPAGPPPPTTATAARAARLDRAPGDGVPSRRDPAAPAQPGRPLRRRDQVHPRQRRRHHGAGLRHHPDLPGAHHRARRVGGLAGVPRHRVDPGHLPGRRHPGLAGALARHRRGRPSCSPGSWRS